MRARRGLSGSMGRRRAVSAPPAISAATNQSGRNGRISGASVQRATSRSQGQSQKRRSSRTERGSAPCSSQGQRRQFMPFLSATDMIVADLSGYVGLRRVAQRHEGCRAAALVQVQQNVLQFVGYDGADYDDGRSIGQTPALFGDNGGDGPPSIAGEARQGFQYFNELIRTQAWGTRRRSPPGWTTALAYMPVGCVFSHAQRAMEAPALMAYSRSSTSSPSIR